MPDAAVNCADPCVAHVRFATDKIGYAYGDEPVSSDTSQAFLMTTNGGRSWRREPGGADALETLDGNVIRVVDAGNCPPGCRFRVQLAPIGSTAWRTVALPGSQGGGDSVQLVRTGRLAALEVYANPAGGASALSVLFTSTDDGATWTRRGEPCPRAAGSGSGFGNEIDSSRLTSAPDGSMSVLCMTRGEIGPQFTMTSIDGGAHFVTADRNALGSAAISAFATASARTVLVSSDATYRSTDGGGHFARLSPGQVAWLGFASPTVGHAISSDRRTIWTTTDAGLRWSQHTFA
ncbi:MAG TPA: sialidase family protein [Jatrophihabitans sp.]|nr:sialidase family protein [Jatrophihabitans sp.]